MSKYLSAFNFFVAGFALAILFVSIRDNNISGLIVQPFLFISNIIMGLYMLRKNNV